MFTLACWNVGGITLFKTPPGERAAVREAFNRDLATLIEEYSPDVVVLQEIVRYGIENGPDKGQICELFSEPEGYYYASSVAIDTYHNYHPVKWQPLRNAGSWENDTYLGQGYGILWRSDIPHCSIWETDESLARPHKTLQKENVRIESGLFTGNRDTEPRVFVVSRFLIGNRDIFVVNLHLTTLKKEREGFPERDNAGAKIRNDQVNVMLNGIVTRMNNYRAEENKLRKAENRPLLPPALWFIAGDFNAVPDSQEIQHIERMNFARLCDNQPTKGKKSVDGEIVPEIKVDYIFAGPQYHAFEPSEIASIEFDVLYKLKSSDHYPLCAHFAL